MRSLLILLGLPVLFATAPASAREEIIEGTATAIEGDALTLQGTRIRLGGIDAPDPGQTCTTRLGRTYDCGEMARRTLEALLDGRTVSCTLSGPPARDGMRAGRCVSEGKSIAGAMVIRGWAFAAIRLSHEYVPVQAAAQSRKAGMWDGRVDAPWIWRTRQLQN